MTNTARVSGTIKVCEFLRDEIPKHLSDNGLNKNRLLLDGEVYEGPVVDWVHKLVNGLSEMGKRALAEIHPDHEPKPRRASPEALAMLKSGQGFATSDAEGRWIADMEEGVYDEDMPEPAAPSSAGTVSVEAAAWVLLEGFERAQIDSSIIKLFQNGQHVAALRALAGK